MRRLIINADDFGLTPGVNQAILESHQHGVVTSATLMANSIAFADAVRDAHSVPSLGIGCHIVLIDGSPLIPPEKVSSLVGSDGTFYNSLAKFACSAFLSQFDPAQMEAEAIAQIRKLQAEGIPVTHADTHKHTHMFPQVLGPVLSALKTCGVRAIRNPFEPLQWSQVTRSPQLWKRWLEVKALRTLASHFRKTTDAAGILTPDGTLGIAATGMLDEQLFRTIVDAMPEGTWEFVCHPGYNNDALQNIRTRLRSSREQEFSLLTSAASRQLLESNGIQLMSYRDYIEGTFGRAHLPS